MGSRRASSVSEDDRLKDPVIIRACTESDLCKLEWGGLFTSHREILRSAFRRQRERGDVAMLVADRDGLPVGQVWIDFARFAPDGAAYVWAVRVHPDLQGSGIGTLMMLAAEDVSRRRPMARAHLMVERHNERALRFYERLGYTPIGDLVERFEYTTPEGQAVAVDLDEIVMGKRL